MRGGSCFLLERGSASNECRLVSLNMYICVHVMYMGVYYTSVRVDALFLVCFMALLR